MSHSGGYNLHNHAVKLAPYGVCTLVYYEGVVCIKLCYYSIMLLTTLSAVDRLLCILKLFHQKVLLTFLGAQILQEKSDLDLLFTEQTHCIKYTTKNSPGPTEVIGLN